MPTNLPSSFASAAAGQNANRGSRGNTGEWPRRDGRSANGTLTLRRTSTTPLNQTSQTPAPSDSTPHSPTAADPPTLSSSSAQPPAPPLQELAPARYTREELLAIAQNSRPVNQVSRLFMPGWNPGQVNGNGGPPSRAWGKSNENHVPQEPGACWDETAESTPLGVQAMSPDEREIFASDINSPLKPPSMVKDNAGPAPVNGRKISLSQGTANAFGLTSPSSATRPGTRRRETGDSNTLSGLNSPPAAGRTPREDSSFWFSRKTTADLRESSEADESSDAADLASRDASNKFPFGNLIRSNTGGTTPTGGGMGSIWSPSNPSTPSAGAFGSFALGGTSSADKRVGGTGGGGGGGSRLAHLIPKDGSDSNATATRQAEGQNPLNQASWRSRNRADTDPFGEDPPPSGSAALGGAQDTAASAPSAPSRVGTLGTPVKGSAGDFGMSGLNLGDTDPTSPSETNPFRSPVDKQDQEDAGDAASTGRMYGGAGLFHDPLTSMHPLQRAFNGAPDAHDRSQTSSAGTKGFPLGHMSAWAAPGGPTSSTPDRERTGLTSGPFSPGIFSSMGGAGDTTPGGSMGGLGGLFGHGGAAGPVGTGSIGRGSKLGSLFPAAMQAQMQQAQEQHDDGAAAHAAANPLGAIGRGSFPLPPMRDTESPMRSSRGVFEELFPSSDASRGLHGGAAGDPGSASAIPQSFTPVSGGAMGFGGAVEPPTAQTRTMVMPDRMRWVYLDPQGQIQGPFTGLEMNDWYKAHFFTPDLRVKKVEDPEFEPLGQLIRRIGNSREPFLVPQVGIPHGPPSQASGFPAANTGGVVPPLSGVFPSFGRTLTAEEQNNLERRKQEEQYMMAQQRDYAMRQSAMSRFQGQQPGLQHHSSAQSLQSQPSFGSIASPMGQMSLGQQQPIGGGGLPIGAGAPSGAAGFFDPATAGLDNRPGMQLASGNDLPPVGDDFLAHLSVNERQVLAAIQSGQVSSQQGMEALQNLGGLRSDLPSIDDLGEDGEGFRERLMEFQNLRAQRDAEDAAAAAEQQQQQQQQQQVPSTAAKAAAKAAGEDGPASAAAPAPAPAQQQQSEPTSSHSKARGRKDIDESNLSLTQQVQKAQAEAAAAQDGSPDMPMPFPPPSSSTPLPAPTAQRARSNLPEQYSRPRTQTPGDEHAAAVAPSQPPPLAPWAKETANSDAHKGPSLKEIQEAEARKAAKAEEAAMAARKAALEQEVSSIREKERQAASAAAAGLPATSTWGHASPVAGASPWATNPGAAKSSLAPAPSASAASKKTLAEIQREEESRKQRESSSSSNGIATQQQQQPQPQQQTRAAPGGAAKSYANLASPSVGGVLAPAPPPGAGWATVGAGGKVKVPTGPAAVQPRSASTTGAKPAGTPVASPSAVKPMSRPGPAANGNVAMDEFRKWVQRELSRGLSVNDISGFASTLEALPLDKGIIADAIYASSNIMDGRHFAEEYVRRKGLAERGVVEKQPVTSLFSAVDAGKASGASSGGWSEVAKKSGGGSGTPGAAVGSASPSPAGVVASDPIQAAGFKVVPSRKKGKK